MTGLWRTLCQSWLQPTAPAGSPPADPLPPHLSDHLSRDIGLTPRNRPLAPESILDRNIRIAHTIAYLHLYR